MSVPIRKVLTIAGSDSGGGAGIQADLKTCSALGCYGMSAITALTAQNTQAVREVFPVPAEFVKAQIEAVLDDLGADAVKIGMLNTADIIEAVADALKKYAPPHIVLDPVMVAKSGDPLLKSSAVKALKSSLMPLASLITPNIPEAEVLLAQKINSSDQMEQAAKDLSKMGASAVLIKGGHGTDELSADCLLCSDGTVHWFKSPRIDSKNTHGTGCTLSSAIASYLAKGEDMISAVSHAKTYISEAILAAREMALGKGHGPVHHFYNVW